MTGRMLLRGATITTGPDPVDVVVDDGVVTEIRPATDRAEAGSGSLDLSGYLLLAAAVEPHAHLDKVLLASRAPNPAGDLMGAIAANREIYDSITAEDIHERAVRVVDAAVRHGYRRIRTHVNVEPGIDLVGVKALRALAAEVADAVEIQTVALTGPAPDDETAATLRRLMTAALEQGADVVGGAPWTDPDPSASVRWLVDCAADAAVPVDLHLDETLDASSVALRHFIDHVERRGLAGRAVASHCVSLGQQDPREIARTAQALARSGIALVTLPQTNLWLQGRDVPSRTPRGLAPIRALRDAGVTVAAGGDNVQDMFNPLGRVDPFETAGLLVAAAHLSAEEAWECVTTGAAAATGAVPAGVRIGGQADLLAVRANSLAEAVATAPADRIVLHRGRIVARSDLTVQRGYDWAARTYPGRTP